ncbi:hypothetical protein CJF31_00002620 [Rutstroemia sp. NJR-2017a BVV2]|nr:hypothetical protein CJF31_00002620 [Rutstroemia sp. NJR-2017a BVV2]
MRMRKLMFEKARKELVVGIIDVVRTYTWDKKLESWIKGKSSKSHISYRGFAGGGRNRPTVTSPKLASAPRWSTTERFEADD